MYSLVMESSATPGSASYSCNKKKGVPLKSSPMICVSYVNICIGYHSILNKCLKHNDSF